MGYLFGGGIETDGTRYGATYYGNLGGIEDTNLFVLFYGIKF